MKDQHLRAAWAGVTPEDRAVGLRSYPSYHASIREFARFYEAPFVASVEAFAALSPNNDYHGNLRSLATLLYARAAGVPLENLTVSTYRACALRAWGYLSGETSFLDTVTGPKITAFRHNILYPETSGMVTVDGHMLCVWKGQDMTMSEAALSLRGGEYEAIVKAVRRIARAASLPAPAVQAALWVNRKRTRGILFSEQRSLFTGAGRWDDTCHPMDYPPFDVDGWKKWVAAKKM